MNSEMSNDVPACPPALVAYRLTQYGEEGIRVHTSSDHADYWLAYGDLHALPFETSGYRRVPFIEMRANEAKAALRAMIHGRPDLIAPLARPIEEGR